MTERLQPPGFIEPGHEGNLLPQEGLQPARWNTLRVLASPEVVRAAVARAFGRGSQLGDLRVKGMDTNRGAVLEVRVGKRTLGVELQYLAGDECTQVQVVVPLDQGVRDAELKRILRWLTLALTSANCRIEPASTSDGRK